MSSKYRPRRWREKRTPKVLIKFTSGWKRHLKPVPLSLFRKIQAEYRAISVPICTFATVHRYRPDPIGCAEPSKLSRVNAYLESHGLPSIHIDESVPHGEIRVKGSDATNQGNA